MNLSFFRKPGRYIGSEINSIRKEFLKTDLFVVRLALCFPDIYEVGMSHLGLKVLYSIINDLPYACAERVFSPWTDLEDYMRKNSVLLSSLESNTPMRDFDVVGFSLQYELSYTTVLNMLNLGGIPLYSEERITFKDNLPIVIAGGPCTSNPAPMSAFIDAFLIGDGEYAVSELIDKVRQWKIAGDRSRETLLFEISKIDGFYVPSVHGFQTRINRRFVAELNDTPYPISPVVPYVSIVHDRINIEVSRGCTMGCRFCQAGMLYRPLRERSPDRIISIAEQSIMNTGYDEVSFTSLSAGDYSYLLPVVKEFNRRFGESRIALSLPSLRVASIDRDVLREIKSIRKTGFTMAPEAATKRLRNVINKDFEEEDYERALHALFAEGWLNLKLYFMIGLPTECDEDIEAIPLMALRALKIAKKYSGRFVNIGITISPFVPKPHTPFQWCGQISLEEIRRKQIFLRKELDARKFKYKGHNNEMSFLEAVFARGDRRLSSLIEMAWKNGCRLDGWSELFDFNKWLDAMDKTGIDGSFYSERVFDRDEILPWNNIDIGVKKDFLYREYEKALHGERTQDCKKVCNGCGLKCREKENTINLVTPKPIHSVIPSLHKIKVRVQFSKTGKLRYLSHLELMSAILRGLRRADVPLSFSRGFHPLPEVSFGPSLGVGVAGEKEYFDMKVFAPFDAEIFKRRVNMVMPEGILINKAAVIPMEAPSLNSFIKRYEYIVRSDGNSSIKVKKIVFPVIVLRDGIEVDISPCIEDFMVSDDERELKLILKNHDRINVRIGEVIEVLTGMKAELMDIVRTAVYGWKDGWVEPL